MKIFPQALIPRSLEIICKVLRIIYTPWGIGGVGGGGGGPWYGPGTCLTEGRGLWRTFVHSASVRQQRVIICKPVVSFYCIAASLIVWPLAGQTKNLMRGFGSEVLFLVMVHCERHR